MSSPPSPPSPVSRDPDQPVAEPPSPSRRVVNVTETLPSGAPTTGPPVASFDAALPRPPFFSMGGNDFRHPSLRGSIVSSLPGTPGPGSNGSLQALHEPHAAAGLDEVQAFASEEHGGLGSTNLSEKHVRGNAGAKKRWILGGVTALVVVLGVSIPLAVLLSGRHSSSAESPSAASAAPDNSPTTAPTAAPSTGGTKPQLSLAVTGGDGSTITIDDGTNFTYTNKFGGFWYFDSEDVFKNAAKCNSWTPALNETFQFGSDRIFGVNLGGWLTTEPFISPALYEKYINHTSSVVDEWTLSQAMTKDTAGNGPSQLEDHYKTFITERDFAQIAGAGLNFVRIPLPYWAIETRHGEPFLAKVAWTYFLKAIEWARKYGIRINLDLHALPGSQNGWNHSGREGTVNMLYGPMGYANAQRSLDYIRILAEFISQPQYRDVVVMFGITNEPQGSGVSPIGRENIQRFYLEAYNVVRAASGSGQGPWISYHEAFLGLNQWVGFLPGADRISLDQHPYFAFGNQPSGTLDDVMTSFARKPCDANQWGQSTNASIDAFGLTAAGEFSLAVTDCAKWLPGVKNGYRYDGTYPGSARVGSCDPWMDWQSWDDTFKQSMMQFALSSMDALQDWFFWTWKIGNSSVTNSVMSPAWSYQLGLENGWIPKDPRAAQGVCKNAFPRTSTGLPNASGIPATATQGIMWPPTTIANAGSVTDLPSYAPTGAIITLPGPTFSPASGQPQPTVTPSVGNGWSNPSDSAGMMIPISTCSYLDSWVGPTPPPSPLCGS